ncbi:MAG: CPBP family intramembrane metalloprotease [Candidatus Omnitrophica bacterium]|nr:CPBP family intramembrane metalloprotease [Candidatus Omnitrophota bacterium]
MDTEKKKDNSPKGFSDVWMFVACASCVCFFVNWLRVSRGMSIPGFIAPFVIGLLAFFFQAFMHQRPLIELYSKSHPYRKLKPYGVISAFLLFEFLLMWGLYTKQIVTTGTGLCLINLVFIGLIVYYHAFVRMKVSLRFLFLAIFIPILAGGAALGLGSYFMILKFVVPAQKVGNAVFFNTLYWILFSIFLQMICEEPAFRGYLMQRLLEKGEIFAIALSASLFAAWRISFIMFTELSMSFVLVMFCANLIMGAIFALLFIKSRNLLVAILCHGLINGFFNSLFAHSANPGMREYVEFLIPQGQGYLVVLWSGCLFVGLILLTIIPRKKFHAY